MGQVKSVRSRAEADQRIAFQIREGLFQELPEGGDDNMNSLFRR